MSTPDFARLSQATLKAIRLLDEDGGEPGSAEADPAPGDRYENDEVRIAWRTDGLSITLLDAEEELSLSEGELGGIRLSRSVQVEPPNWFYKLLGQKAAKHHLLHVELKSSQRMNLTLSAEVEDPSALEGLPRHVGSGLLISLDALRRVVAHARRLGATYRSWRSHVSLPHLKLPGRASLLSLPAAQTTPKTDDERVAALQATLEREPLNSRARRDLTRLYAKLGRHDARVQLLQEEALGTSSNSRRLALLEQIVEICERELGDGARALSVQRDILTFAPTHQPSLDAILDDLRRKKRWSELRVRLGHKLETLRGAEQIPIRIERARVLADHLDATREALSDLERVLELDASHEEARALFTRLLSERR